MVLYVFYLHIYTIYVHTRTNVYIYIYLITYRVLLHLNNLEATGSSCGLWLQPALGAGHPGAQASPKHSVENLLRTEQGWPNLVGNCAAKFQGKRWLNGYWMDDDDIEWMIFTQLIFTTDDGIHWNKLNGFWDWIHIDIIYLTHPDAFLFFYDISTEKRGMPNCARGCA